MKNRIEHRNDLLSEHERAELIAELRRRALKGDNGAAAVLLHQPRAAEPRREKGQSNA